MGRQRRDQRRPARRHFRAVDGSGTSPLEQGGRREAPLPHGRPEAQLELVATTRASRLRGDGHCARRWPIAGWSVEDRVLTGCPVTGCPVEDRVLTDDRTAGAVGRLEPAAAVGRLEQTGAVDDPRHLRPSRVEPLVEPLAGARAALDLGAPRAHPGGHAGQRGRGPMVDHVAGGFVSR